MNSHLYHDSSWSLEFFLCQSHHASLPLVQLVYAHVFNLIVNLLHVSMYRSLATPCSFFFKHTLSRKTDWLTQFIVASDLNILLSCALGSTALAVALQATRVMPFHFRRHTMASKADLIFVEDAPLVPLPIIHLPARKCVREQKDFLLAVKTFFRCAGCLKTKGIYWGLICLSIFYLQPDRCKRLFLQPPASHSRCPSFKGPFENKARKRFSVASRPGMPQRDDTWN